MLLLTTRKLDSSKNFLPPSRWGYVVPHLPRFSLGVMKVEYSFLNETDRQVVSLSGYGAQREKRGKAALIVIDAQNKFIGPNKPILEVVADHPLAMGARAHKAIQNIGLILETARKKGVPVFYTINKLDPSETVFNSFAKKRPPYEKNGRIDSQGEEIVESLTPQEGEWVIHKRYASALFGTPLLSFLNALGCTTLILVGFSTSGCIRACAVDAASYNLCPIVVEDAVADRIEYSHQASLMDLNLKYADVLSTSDVISYMNGIEREKINE